MSKIIGLIGAPSTGKTTLCLNLVTKLSLSGYNTKQIIEYPRDYIEKYQHPTHISEQFLIFLTWKELLDNALAIKYDYLICDSPLFAGYIYGINEANIADKKDRLWIREFLELSLKTIAIYDHIFYIKTKKQFKIKDGLRKSDLTICKKLDEQIYGFLKLYNIPFTEIINDDLEQTTNKIIKEIT